MKKSDLKSMEDIEKKTSKSSKGIKNRPQKGVDMDRGMHAKGESNL